MEYKVLVAVDQSENALRAVEYVAGMMKHHPECRIALHHVIISPSPDIVPDEAERKATVKRMREEALMQLEKAGHVLTGAGISEKSIRLNLQVCRESKSIVELILYEQRQGGYETVVVGRRGVSKREEFIFGSVSSKLIREARHCTVWVVE